MRVPDLEASTRWFVEKLDFRVVKTWPFNEHRLAWLSPANDDALVIELIGGNSPEPNPDFGSLDESLEYAGFHHLCLDVADLERTITELRRRGANLIVGPFELPEIRRRHIFVSDPWGNMIELGQTVG
jgi:lactoylglutathione lyase/glyoxylase I family protein